MPAAAHRRTTARGHPAPAGANTQGAPPGAHADRHRQHHARTSPPIDAEPDAAHPRQARDTARPRLKAAGLQAHLRARPHDRWRRAHHRRARAGGKRQGADDQREAFPETQFGLVQSIENLTTDGWRAEDCTNSVLRRRVLALRFAEAAQSPFTGRLRVCERGTPSSSSFSRSISALSSAPKSSATFVSQSHATSTMAPAKVP